MLITFIEKELAQDFPIIKPSTKFIFDSMSFERSKRWQLHVLPQYLANLTQPEGTDRKAYFLGEVPPCTNNIVYTWFVGFRTFLCVFMSAIRAFVRWKLWVNVPVR